jgi:hypothetical protein
MEDGRWKMEATTIDPIPQIFLKEMRGKGEKKRVWRAAC